MVRGLVAVVGAYAAGEGEEGRRRGGKDELGCDVWRPNDQQLDDRVGSQANEGGRIKGQSIEEEKKRRRRRRKTQSTRSRKKKRARRTKRKGNR
ncbi:hypothetical protein C7212DRAFT_306026 [Tuber magnatum]|uniref:Uncharacterized protein n=1 Tax=Tuber magnatum TaxID=42249 RepID=A0A317T0J8_9PEZI|nr:hypothetical protein C7212DRAFT_306026 [Tuber magnatum]